MRHLVGGTSKGARVDLRPDNFSVSAIKVRLKRPDDSGPFEQVEQSVPFLGLGKEVNHFDRRQALAVRIAQHLHQSRIGIDDSPVASDPEQAHGNVIKQALETPLRLVQGFPLFGPFQRHVHGGSQAGIVSGRFENVIVQPGFHRLHRNLFIAASGEHDHRAVRPAHFDGEHYSDSVTPA